MKFVKSLGLTAVMFLLMGFFYSIISFNWWRHLRRQRDPNAWWFVLYGTMGVISTSLMTVALLSSWNAQTKVGMEVLSCAIGIAGSTRQMDLIVLLRRQNPAQRRFPFAVFPG